MRCRDVHCTPLPSQFCFAQTEAVVTSTCRGFVATCEVAGRVFKSNDGKLYQNKKTAEQAIAALVWDSGKES